MKIIHILWSLKYGGAETMLLDIINRQCIHHDVELLIVNQDNDDELLSQVNPRIRIRRINRPHRSKNPYYIFQINLFLLFSKADIIHSHMDDFVKYYPLSFLKNNLYLTIHSVRLGYKGIHKYNHLFAISDEVCESIRKQTGLETTVVYNGIDIKQFNREKNSPTNHLFKIIQIGRLDHPCKGQHLTLKAIHLLVTKYQYTDFHVDIIGEGNSEKYLKELCNQLKMDAYVTFCGTKTKTYIQENLTHYDLLVQPSLYEGFGLTIIEAMNAMTPTLISNVDGMKTASCNGENSYTFQSGNVEDYATQLLKIIQKPATERIQLAEKAYPYVCQHFDISVTVDNYLKYYKNPPRA